MGERMEEDTLEKEKRVEEGGRGEEVGEEGEEQREDKTREERESEENGGEER